MQDPPAADRIYVGLLFAIGGGVVGGYAGLGLTSSRENIVGAVVGAAVGALGGFALGYHLAGSIPSEDEDDEQNGRAQRNTAITLSDFLQPHGDAGRDFTLSMPTR